MTKTGVDCVTNPIVNMIMWLLQVLADSNFSPIVKNIIINIKLIIVNDENYSKFNIYPYLMSKSYEIIPIKSHSSNAF